MKSILKIINTMCIITFVLVGCNNSDDKVIDENINSLTVEVLISDQEFLETVDKLYMVSDQITDLAVVLTLIEKHLETAVGLTDDEQQQLAVASGFTSIEDKFNAQNEFWKSWSKVVEHFNLVSIDREIVLQALMEASLRIEASGKNFSRIHKTYLKAIDDCEIDDRDCECRNFKNGCMERALNGLLNETNGGRCDSRGCGPLIDNPIFTDIIISDIAGCNFNYECCLIGYDSAECSRMF